METAILSMIPAGDPDLTTYLNWLLRGIEPEQQNDTFWSSISEKTGKMEDHTPVQPLILKELHERKEKEKLNPKDDMESEC